MSFKLLPDLGRTPPPLHFSSRLHASSFLHLPPPSSSSLVRIRSSPIIFRCHHITQQLVAGNQSACLTPPDGPPPLPPSRPCSSSSPPPPVSRCLPILLHVSGIITLRSPRTIWGYLSSVRAVIGGGSTFCLPRVLNLVLGCNRRSKQNPRF